MSSQEDKLAEASGWMNKDFSEIDIKSEDFVELTNYFSSIVDAAEICDLESEFKNCGHKDVTFEIQTQHVRGHRELVLRLTVENWKKHTGGSSPYTRMEQNDLGYQCTSNSDRPADDIVETGAFFHLLFNEFKKVGTEIPHVIFPPELVDYTDQYAIFETTISCPKLDDN